MDALLSRMDTVDEREVKWLWPGRLPLGNVTMVAGDPGVDKSFLTTWLAARVSRADDFPDARCGLRKPGDVLMLSAEDDPADTIRPRLRLHGADLKRVHVMEGVREGNRVAGVDLDRHLGQVEEALKGLERPRLLVVDPISAYLGATDGNSNSGVRGLLRELAGLAQKYGPAVLCVTHLNKNGGAGASGGASRVMYRAMGSLAFVAAARLAYYVRPHPDDESLRCMAMIKSNLDTRPRVMTYRLGPAGLAWESVDAPLTLRDLEMERADDEPARAHQGEAFLQRVLRSGPAPAAAALAQGAREGLSPGVLRRAKERLGIVVRKQGMDAGWTWSLPTAAPGDPDAGGGGS